MSKKNEVDSHIYINKNGIEVPSVTHILNIMNREGMLSWANFIGLKGVRVKEYMNKRAMIGTFLHAYINKTLTGVDINFNEINSVLKHEDVMEVYDLYTYFKLWRNEVKPHVMYSEYSMIGKKYGGTLDIIYSTDDKVVLGDFKTSKVIDKKYFIQLAGYLNLLEETNNDVYKQITHCQVISISLKNKIQVEEKTIEEMLGYKVVFTYAYILYNEYEKLLIRDYGKNLKNLNIF